MNILSNSCQNTAKYYDSHITSIVPCVIHITVL